MFNPEMPGSERANRESHPAPGIDRRRKVELAIEEANFRSKKFEARQAFMRQLVILVAVLGVALAFISIFAILPSKVPPSEESLVFHFVYFVLDEVLSIKPTYAFGVGLLMMGVAAVAFLFLVYVSRRGLAFYEATIVLVCGAKCWVRT
jgi:hypothetical protein